MGDLCTVQPNVGQIQGPSVHQPSSTGQTQALHVEPVTTRPHPALFIAAASLPTPTDNALQHIIVKAMNEGKRPTRIRMGVNLFNFFVIQVFLVFGLVLFIPYMVGINVFWLCDNWGNSVVSFWIAITGFLAGIIRTGAQSARLSKVEIFHLRPLPPSFVFEPCQNCVPTHPVQRTGPITIGKWYGIGPRISEYLSFLLLLPRYLWRIQKLRQSMVVVLRPSGIVELDQMDVKGFLYGVTQGVIQSILLIFLTVLFGSTYLGSIMEAAIFLVSFVGVIVLSRTYSVYFRAWMENAADSIVIEYASPAELTAIHTALVGMPGLLIHDTTRGRKYGEGNCLTPDPGCTNHISSTAKPLPLILRITTALSFGLLVLGPMIGIWWLRGVVLNVVDSFGRLYDGIFWFTFVVVVVVSVINKVYYDFGWVDALGVDVGTALP